MRSIAFLPDGGVIILEAQKLQIKLFKDQNMPYYYLFDNYNDKEIITDIYCNADEKMEEIYKKRPADALEICLDKIPNELQSKKVFFLHICLKIVETKFMKITIIENGHCLAYRNYYNRGIYFKNELLGGIAAKVDYRAINYGIKKGYSYCRLDSMPQCVIPFPVFFAMNIKNPYKTHKAAKRSTARQILGQATCTDVVYFYGKNITRRDERHIKALLRIEQKEVEQIKKRRLTFILRLENFKLFDSPTALVFEKDIKQWQYFFPDASNDKKNFLSEVRKVGLKRATLNCKLEKEYPKWFGF